MKIYLDISETSNLCAKHFKVLFCVFVFNYTINILTLSRVSLKDFWLLLNWKNMHIWVSFPRTGILAILGKFFEKVNAYYGKTKRGSLVFLTANADRRAVSFTLPE